MTDQCTIYTGDLLIAINEDGDYDINYINGQPCMTDGFDTAVLQATFGEPDFWQNDLTNDPNEQYISKFPEVIRTGKVNDKTIKDGTAALNEAMKFMVDSGAASEVNIEGGILSVYGLYWTIEIINGSITNKYKINWDKGVVAVLGIPKFTGRIKPQKFNEPMLNPNSQEMQNPNGNIMLYEFYE